MAQKPMSPQFGDVWPQQAQKVCVWVKLSRVSKELVRKAGAKLAQYFS